jgi:hypothetical protein
VETTLAVDASDAGALPLREEALGEVGRLLVTGETGRLACSGAATLAGAAGTASAGRRAPHLAQNFAAAF